MRAFLRALLAVALCAAMAVPAVAQAAPDLAAGGLLAQDAAVVATYDVSAGGDEALVADLLGDGTLRLRGEGPMRDYDRAADAPWSAHAADISAIELPEGLTSIGSFAFSGLSNAALCAVRVPAAVTDIGACAFADSTALAAIDLTGAALMTHVGDGAFCNPSAGMTVYVSGAEAATHVTPAAVQGGGYAGGTVLADTTALAVCNGGALPEGADFAPGELARPLSKEGYTFAAWTTDSALMHPDPGWHALSTGAYYAKFQASAGWADDPVPYAGYQGLDQQVRLLNADALPSVELADGIVTYGEDDAAFVNAFTEPLDGDADIRFAFGIVRGSAANGGDGSYQRSFTLPYVRIEDSNGATVAAWDGGAGALQLFDTLFDATPGAQQGNTITAFTVGVFGDTLPAGDYALVFDKGLGANNGISFLGKDVRFSFTVARSGAGGGDEVDLPDGVYVNGAPVPDGGEAVLPAAAPDATVQVVRGRRDVTRYYAGFVSNANAVSHEGTAPGRWQDLTAVANGACQLVLRTQAGVEFARVRLRAEGFAADASTAPVPLAAGEYQGNGATIRLARVGDAAATVSVAVHDETLAYFDDYVAEPVYVSGGNFTLLLGGPGMYWEPSRWDFDDWKANHLDPYLSVVDARGLTVATVGGGLRWLDLGTSNTVVLGVDEGVLRAGEEYVLVAGADLTGHNVAASLQKEVRWTFTAQEVDAGDEPGAGDGGDQGGKPAEPAGPAQWKRLWGENAYGTMQRVVREGFAASDAVVVATFDGYWDALAASSLAGVLHAPVLLTATGRLSDECASEIDRLGATRAYIVGGTAAVGADVERAISARGLSVSRLAGDDALGTARAIADEVGERAGATCVVATSGGYWDALAASPFAYADAAPIYLTRADGTLDGATLEAIRAHGYGRAVIAGGTAAVAASAEGALAGAGVADVRRLGGENAYGTSIALARWCLGQGMTADGLGVATASGYWDALCGAALCGSRGSVLVLADAGHSEAVGQLVAPCAASMRTGYVFGGTAAVAASVLDECERATS